MNFEKQERFKPLRNSNEILKNKKVAIAGIGGLGSHSAEYMVRMGVGTIILIDGDFVEESNLPRQGLYNQEDFLEHHYKVLAAKRELERISPNTKILTYCQMLSDKNINRVLKDVDLVLDGTDNMAARYLINDYCFSHNIPWIYAAATASTGVVSSFIPGKTPCLRCIYGDPAEDQISCDINGIILPALTFITSIQTTEALKILLGYEPMKGELRYDIWTRQETFFDTSLLKNESCTCQKGCQEAKKKHKYYMICSGDTIQVNTEITKHKISKMFLPYGFTPTKENDLFVELQSLKEKNKKIVGYKTGKIIFHQINQKEVEKMIN